MHLKAYTWTGLLYKNYTQVWAYRQPLPAELFWYKLLRV